MNKKEILLLSFYLKKILNIEIDIENWELLISKFNNYIYLNYYQIENPLVYKIDFYNNKRKFLFIYLMENYILEIVKILIFNFITNKKDKRLLYRNFKKLFFLEKKILKYNIKNIYKNEAKNILKYYKYYSGNSSYIHYYFNLNVNEYNNSTFLLFENIKIINLEKFFLNTLKIPENELKRFKKLKFFLDKFRYSV